MTVLTALALFPAFGLNPIFTPQAQAQIKTQQREDWVLLTAREVDRGKSRESIDLRDAKGQVRAIRLIARNGGLELTKISITYADGRVHDEARHINMNPNDRTRPIDAGGADRFVDAVDLIIQPERTPAGARRTTLIEIWGIQTPDGARAVRPAAVAQATAPAPPSAPPPASTPPSPAVPDGPPVSAPAPSAAVSEPPSPTKPPEPPAPPAARRADLPADGLRPAASSPPSSVTPPIAAEASSSPTLGPTLGPTPGPVVPQGAAPPLPPPRGADGRPDPRIAMQQQRKAVPPPTPTPVGNAEKDSNGGIFLGRQPLAGRDTDVVQISVGGGRFARLRVRALEAPARIERLSIDFGLGAAEELTVGAEVPANGVSAWIAVPRDRAIRQVAVTYSRQSAARSAGTLELLGEYVPGYLDPGGEGARDPRHNGWVPLGASSAALRVGFDQLELPIADNKGGFKKLRVDVRDRAITLRELRVVYGTGEDEIITIDSARQKISAGASFGPIDLRGGTRLVKRIVLKSRSRFLDSEARGRDAAIVEVWGQH